MALSGGAIGDVSACLLRESVFIVASGLLSSPTKDERGVKNRPNLRGVTDGALLSFCCTDRVGERNWLRTGDEGGSMATGGLDGMSSLEGPKW